MSVVYDRNILRHTYRDIALVQDRSILGILVYHIIQYPLRTDHTRVVSISESSTKGRRHKSKILENKN